MYGAAEAAARMSILDWKYAEYKIGSIGKPIWGGKFYLVDNLNKKIKKSNVKGELYIRVKMFLWDIQKVIKI